MSRNKVHAETELESKNNGKIPLA